MKLLPHIPTEYKQMQSPVIKSKGQKYIYYGSEMVIAPFDAEGNRMNSRRYPEQRAGWFVPVRMSPASSRSRYNRHQGKQEMARRIRNGQATVS